MVRTKATEDWDNQHLMLHQAREFEIKILWTEETLFKIKTLLQQTLLVEVKKWPSFKKNERQKKVILFLWKWKVEILIKNKKTLLLLF